MIIIRIISDSANKLTFNQGDLNNSFGAHLLNSGESTNPIPIYGFNANKSGNQSLTSSNTIIGGWSVDGDNHFALPSANFNTTSGVYTIPISGYYQINLIIRINQSNDYSRVYISVNDTNTYFETSTCNLIFVSGNSINGGESNGTLNTVLKLNINDTISIKVQDTNGTVVDEDTHWSCMLLATDTLTNTRQMAVSPIVPLHQLGHDQFAEGRFSIYSISSGDDGNIRIDAGTEQGITIVPSGTPIIQNFTDSTLYYHYNSVNYTTVPISPYSSSSSPQWDYQDYIFIQPVPNRATHDNVYIAGSFTIDTSKLLEIYTGLWEVAWKNDTSVRFKINGNDYFTHMKVVFQKI